MSTFGDRLRSEREDRGFSIRAVAETLGVADERLRALESNDFRALPDNDAIVPCLRAYADCLRVDPELMIEDYVRERDRCLARLDRAVTAAEQQQATAAVPAPLPSALTRQPTLPRWAVVGALALVAVAGGWWMLSGDGTSGDTPASAPEPLARSTGAAREPAQAPAPREIPQAAPPVPAAAGARLEVLEQGVGTRVERRQLMGRGNSFRENTQVWYWTLVEGGHVGDRIEHVWLRDGVEAERTSLKIGGSPWRTYSAKTLHAGSAGAWVVETRDAEDRVLAQQEFDCVR
jgi:transcriptional regulator with XRE-family HTH domain